MLKKTIRYTDYNGNDVQEDFYFHLSKAELVELEASNKEGLAEYLQAIVASKDNLAIIANFKKIIMLSYGVKSEDGKRFIKSEQLREEFSQTEAYSELFIELATVPDSGTAFIQGIIPASLQQQVQAQTIETVELEVSKDPATMSREELLAEFQKKMQNDG